MAISVAISGKTGDVKKIDSQYVKLTDGFGTLWSNINATTVQVSDTNLKVLLLDREATITLAFVADTSEDGQGFHLSHGISAKITAINGTLYTIKSEHISLDENSTDIYNNNFKDVGVVGTIFSNGSMLCSKSSTFSIQILPDNNKPRVIPLPGKIQLKLSDEVDFFWGAADN